MNLAAATAIVTLFSPNGGAEQAVITAINHARHSVHVAIYEFTDRNIASALASAKGRGVDVQVVIDSTAGPKVPCAPCATSVPVCKDAMHPIMHNKYAIIDNAVVITGSFNWTYAADKKNAENLIVLINKDIAARYEANWQIHRSHCRIN